MRMGRGKKICRRIRDVLALEGPRALHDDEGAQRHLEECDGCFAVLEALAELDRALAALPELDASDETVGELLAHPELQRSPDDGKPAESGRQILRFRRRIAALPVPVWLGAAATVIVAVAAVFLTQVWRNELSTPESETAFGLLDGRSRPPSDPASGGLMQSEPLTEEQASQLQALGYLGGGGWPTEAEADEEEAEPRTEMSRMRREVPPARPKPPPSPSPQRQTRTGSLAAGPFPAVPPADAKDESSPASSETVPRRLADLVEMEKEDLAERRSELRRVTPAAGEGSSRDDLVAQSGVDGTLDRSVPASEDRPAWVGGEAPLTFRDGSAGPETVSDEVREALRNRLGRLHRGGSEETGGKDGVGTEVAEPKTKKIAIPDATPDEPEPLVLGDLADVDSELPATDDLVFGIPDIPPVSPSTPGLEPPAEDPRIEAAVRRFQRERQTTTGLRFREAKGYWANTYVPGDPALRLLQARIEARDPAGLQAFAGLDLHKAARPMAQPFDPPENAALGVVLHADRRGLSGESRMLVQVGLQATPRYSGRRPAMNVGVVLDLHGEIDTATATSLRSLVTAFNEHRDVGDRFRLIVAAAPGGRVVPPEEFRHGPLVVALEELLARTGATAEDRSRDDDSEESLSRALATAIEEVSGTDDPTQPLGSSAVILITHRSLGGELDALAAMAHRSAVDGVPVSVVGLGDVVPAELDRLALAGQGHRRLLTAPDEAVELVDRELSAVGRVIARAVRLRIRPAPGVRLVDVVGSYRLDEVQADRVRQAEQSIDRRLSRNLGIQADRGEDEEGIQIVIPGFYAGDSHVVLLDVVASGPGPIADVTVRYKDLVHLRNGVARANLSLPRGERPAGPLERDVLKSYLAYRLHLALATAGERLAGGDRQGAHDDLAAMHRLLAGLRREVPGFDKDRDLERDLGMLSEYQTLLEAGGDQDPGQRDHLADSLRYAGRLKVLPPWVGEGR